MNPIAYPVGFTPHPSNPVTMTELYMHNVNTPKIGGTQGGTRSGMFASIRSVASLAVVQKVANSVTASGIPAYQATMLVKGQA